MIDAAWEDAEFDRPGHQGRCSAGSRPRIWPRCDSGEARIAEKIDGAWAVHQWLKKAVLLSFRLNPMELISGAPGGANSWDKVPSKFAGWGEKDFAAAGYRAVPGAIVRRGAYIAPGAVLMPSFVNIGARVGEGTMVDTWATVGSCAQIGKNVHLSGGAGIGGVLEPLQAAPSIIEDDCFIGARSEVAEGVIVEQGAVLSMGVFPRRLDQDRRPRDGEVCRRSRAGLFGRRSRHIAGRRRRPTSPAPSSSKRVDERTRSKTSINELLRD